MTAWSPARERAGETATPRSRDARPPGPGRWVRETAHQARPFTRHFLAVFYPAFCASLPAGLRRYGVLMRRIDMATVEEWLYSRPLMIGVPRWAARALPPRLAGPAAWLLPEFRRRARAASRAVATRAWREESGQWLGGLREQLVRRNRGVQRVDLARLDDGALAAHLATVRALLRDGDMVHMRHLVAQNIAVGDWVLHTARWTDVEPSQALAALRGASPASVRPLGGLGRLAAAVRDAPAAARALEGTGPPHDRLAALARSSPAVGRALEDYLDGHGDDLLGFDLDEPTLRELPGVVLSALGAQLSSEGDSEPPDVAAEDLRARVPGRHRPAYDTMLDDARLLYGLRDDDVVLTEMRPYGLLRRGLLEAGRRLAGRGAVERPDHVLHTSPPEVDALLCGEGRPAPAELARRAARREASTADPPPLALGVETPGPDPRPLPRDLARVNDALVQGMSLDLLEVAPPPPPEGGRIHGTGASAGTYEGRARIVRGPAELDRLSPGDVLVAPITGPAFNVVLPLIGAVVTDRGGALSHAAVVAREFGVPAVVGTGSAVETVPDGALVRVDGDRGVVTLR